MHGLSPCNGVALAAQPALRYKGTGVPLHLTQRFLYGRLCLRCAQPATVRLTETHLSSGIAESPQPVSLSSNMFQAVNYMDVAALVYDVALSATQRAR